MEANFSSVPKIQVNGIPDKSGVLLIGGVLLLGVFAYYIAVKG